MSTTTHQGAVGAETMTAGTKALSARALAGMLRSRIERAAEHKSETVSLGQFFADQIHRYLTEAGHGPEHDARSGDVPADGGDPDCDRSRDWGLRARQVHLGALSKRAAGGKWFASTNGADGLARLDNGTDGMFPVRGEWHEIEFIEALVNAYRHGDLATPAPRTDGGMTAGEDHAWTFERTRTYLLAELERLRADLHTIGEDLTGEQGKAASWLDVATGRVANVSSVLASATPAQPTGAVPDGLRALSEAATEGDLDTGVTIDEWGDAIFAGPTRRPIARFERQEDAEFFAAAGTYVRIILDSHPAGQSAGSGAETDALVDRFSAALKVKLRAAEAKYGWKNGWLKSNWQVECQNGLLRHVGKGDPLDVAAYAAFCWHHGWPSASRRSTDFVTGAVIPTAGAIAAYETRYPEGSLSETSDNAIEAWNRVAAAVCLAEKPAPDSTRTDQVGVAVEQAVAKAAERAVEQLENAASGGLFHCEADREEAVEIVTEALWTSPLAARPAAPEAQGAWHWTDREGHPVRDAEQGEQWLLTWSEASATYDINCIDGDWPHGDAIKLLCMDAWKWIEASPPAPPASSGQGGR